MQCFIRSRPRTFLLRVISTCRKDVLEPFASVSFEILNSHRQNEQDDIRRNQSENKQDVREEHWQRQLSLNHTVFIRVDLERKTLEDWNMFGYVSSPAAITDVNYLIMLF